MTRRAKESVMLVVVTITTAVLTAGCSKSASAGQDRHRSEHVAHVFDQNQNGQTFGSRRDAQSRRDIPDLILVVARNGQRGYVLKTEMYAEVETITTRIVPVFKEDGTSQVGDFQVILAPGDY